MTRLALPTRRLRGELMDDPGLDRARHRDALRGLRRINVVSRAAGSLYRAVRPWLGPSRPTRVLDVACGGGDVALGLWRRARREGLDVHLIGCDVSAVALDEAHAAAAEAGAPWTSHRGDVLRQPLPEADVAISSLFLHHLEADDVVAALAAMRAAAPRVAISDLRRTTLGYAAAWMGTRLLSRSPIVHVDGPRSVEAAFTEAELRDLAMRAGLVDVTVRPTFPQRMLLTGSRP